MDVRKLTGPGESETVEFKESLRMKDEICETLCAFSNTQGGIILIGVSDSGIIKSVDVGKKTTTDLAEYIKNNTDPNVFPEIKVHETEFGKIILIKVKKSYDKPTFFKNHAYKRVGDTTQRIFSSEIRTLAKESGPREHWDDQICTKATLEDIDWTFVKDFFIPKYESLTKRKTSGSDKNLLEALQGIKNNKPTNAGILLFGKNPQNFFMNAYIALARYKGSEVGVERLDYKEFTGNLFNQIDKCNAYILEHTSIMSRLEPGKIRREDISEYGLFSIRELITNAVCHRDYENQHTKIIIKMFSDKIEFYNPGGLPEDITPENITEKQFSRNRLLAKVLTKVEYIEELGEGWDKIIKEHKEHPLRPRVPLIHSSRSSTLITIFSTSRKFEEQKQKIILTKRQEFVLTKIKSDGYIKSIDIQREFGITRDTANRDLNYLIKNKLIKREGSGKSILYFGY